MEPNRVPAAKHYDGIASYQALIWPTTKTQPQIHFDVCAQIAEAITGAHTSYCTLSVSTHCCPFGYRLQLENTSMSGVMLLS